jgi:endoglycosylceramidase
MRKRALGFAMLAFVTIIGCGQGEPVPQQASPDPPRAAAPEEQPASSGAFVSVDGGKFVDPDGRQVLMHGLSIISKAKQENYQSWHGPREFALMRDWGMNCIRLGIIWDGLEPDPGVFDEAYLKQVDQRIAWARDNGLYVFLDMHQDLFSVLFSDGAPEWATLTDGKPHVAAGGVWSDAYFTSQAVQTAFDNFWANKPCADGVGVQDHFARAWKHVAARYADEPTVLGYDLLNEPNAGSQNPVAQYQMIVKLAEVLAAKDGEGAPTAGEVAMQWLDPKGRSQIMARLSDMDIYVPSMDAAADLFQEFERTKVVPMFQRVTNAIREVDTNHIIFLETSMSANMGIYSGIEPVLGSNGQRDPLQAYAPHGYDIVVDTPDIANASEERVELIFRRHGETAKRLDMPMVVGEWGAYGGAGPEIVKPAWFVVRQFEKLLCGETYWLYGKNLTAASYFEVLNRPIPAEIAGTLLAYEANPKTGAFTCSWKEDPKIAAPNRIYLPARAFPGKDGVVISPAGDGFAVEPAAEGSANVYLVIPPTGEALERSLTVGG